MQKNQTYHEHISYCKDACIFIVRPSSQILIEEVFNAAIVVINLFNQKRYG